MDQPLSFFTLQDDVYSYLRKSILTGLLKPGERIIETEIASRLGISKSPVREAMRKLEADGLIVIKPRIGGFVVNLTEEDIKEIYEIRQAIEGYAVRLLITKNNNKEIINKNLTRILNEYEHAVEIADIFRCNDLDSNFHLYIVKASENKRLIKLALMIYDQAYLVKNMASTIPGRKKRSLKEHKEIFNAIQRQDYIAAQEAIISHLEGLKKDVLSSLKK
ncbi:MAG: hypothetical protein PWP65_1108 [Clostridia bacterium]|nr:hypothetical protein [Clostridia bacterium]